MLAPNKRLAVFSIRETTDKNDEKKAVWVRAGAAWVNRDGSLNVYLDVLPLDGKLHVREALDDRRASPGGTEARTSSANGSPAQEAMLADSMGGH